MFTAAFHTSRHYILYTAMACLCVLLGGPSYAAGAESLIIAGATCYEPGVSGPGWAWTDTDHLELSGFSGEAIGADGDLVVTLTGQNSVKEIQSSIRGHFAVRSGGVGQPDAPRHRFAIGHGIAVRDSRVSGIVGRRLHRQCQGRRGRH